MRRNNRRIPAGLKNTEYEAIMLLLLKDLPEVRNFKSTGNESVSARCISVFSAISSSEYRSSQFWYREAVHVAA